MTDDKTKFIKLKKDKEGFVTFGNDNSSKILGKGIVELGNKASQVENVILVENMRHNLLSMSQTCDQGHTLTFNSRECEIRKEGLGKFVTTTTRTLNNIYILDKVKEEMCFFWKDKRVPAMA